MLTLATTTADTESASAYLVIILITAAVIILVCLALWWGWRNRKKRQTDIVEPSPVPESVLQSEPLVADDGMYVSTVRGRDWLDRIAVHHLGIRTEARLEVHPSGVAMLLSGAPNFFITVDQLTDVRLESGINGKFVEREGLVVISWMLGDQEVSTGFRTRSNTAKRTVYDHLTQLLPPAGPSTARAAQKNTDHRAGSETSE